MTDDCDTMAMPDAEGKASMTLAFHRTAIDDLAYPARAIDDARRWSRFVGIVGDDPDAVQIDVDRYDLHQDFHLGGMETQSVLSRLKWEADTDRYVFIGTDERHRALADYVNWEYQPVAQAADAAGWPLSDRRGPFGLLDAIRWW